MSVQDTIAEHELKTIRQQLEPIITDGSNSIRHLEVMVEIIKEEISRRYEK